MKEDNTYYDGMDGLNLPGSLRVPPFVVPKNYFSQLTDHIQLHIKMEQYKDTVTQDANIPKGYFEDLSDKILAQTRIENAVPRENFVVPANYFESLSGRIQNKIFEDKLKKQVSNDGFVIPEGYTQVLQDKIIVRTVEKARQHTPVRRLHFNKWVSYVAAACIAVIVGIASYNGIYNKTQGSANESHLSSIPDDEIINYLSALNDSDDILYVIECIDHAHDADGVCTHVKENDIEDYLNYAL